LELQRSFGRESMTRSLEPPGLQDSCPVRAEARKSETGREGHQVSDRVISLLEIGWSPTLSPEKRRKDGARRSYKFLWSETWRTGRALSLLEIGWSPTLSPEKRRKDGARRSYKCLGSETWRTGRVISSLRFGDVPPFRQKKGERMGHGDRTDFWGQRPGEPAV